LPGECLRALGLRDASFGIPGDEQAPGSRHQESAGNVLAHVDILPAIIMVIYTARRIAVGADFKPGFFASIKSQQKETRSRAGF
jgi:hypothetical protein